MIATPHPLTYWFISGLAFFPGLALIVAAACVPPGRIPWRRLAVRAAMALGGAALVVLSATPLPTWAYAAGGAAVAAMVVGTDPLGRSRRLAAVVVRLAAVGACLTAAGMELPYHRAAAMPLAAGEALYIIGDSLSAGPDEPPGELWPSLLGARHEVDVVDLATAGATMGDALRQVDALAGGGVIVLAVGVHDLLARRAPDAFGRDLDALVAAIHAKGPYRVIVLELPLPPLAHRYGLAQRRAIRALPNKTLLPRRTLAGILTTPGATVDGIHLSREGHMQMAEAIWRVLQRR